VKNLIPVKFQETQGDIEMMKRNAGMEGSSVWLIPDGDLPPPGKGRLKGHESLMILNTNRKNARIRLDFFFEEKDPVRDIKVSVLGERVRCFRLDTPLGEKGYRVPCGQYALRIRSDVPVVVQFGRMDVRQPNLAYYGTMAYPVR
jgi:hypothetical protein